MGRIAFPQQAEVAVQRGQQQYPLLDQKEIFNQFRVDQQLEIGFKNQRKNPKNYKEKINLKNLKNQKRKKFKK